MSMTIVTNNVPRFTIDWHDLTDKEREWFDYIKDGEGTFFRYRGQAYDMGEFMKGPFVLDFIEWHGYTGDSYFSGTLVKVCDDGESVIVGRYYC